MANLSESRFRRAFVATVTVLVVLVGGFVALTSQQGPKLSSAQIDVGGVVTKSNEQLRMFANQQVRPVTAAQVRITPSARFAVTTAGSVIAVQFANPLRYGTRYRVSVDGVASASDGQSSSITYEFSTESPTLYYLHRSGGSGPDQIMTTGIRQPSLRVAYSAPRIQAFAAFPHALAVVTLSASGHSSLNLIGSQGQVEHINLPGAGTVDQLQADEDSGILGFTFTDAGPTPKRAYSDTLFTVDPNGTAVPQPVKGLDGQPVSVLDWSFVPSSSDIVAQNIDESTILIDTAKANSVTPLGTFLELGAVAADGKSVVVVDVNGQLQLSLATGKTTRLSPALLHGATVMGAAAETLTTGWLQQESVYDKKIRGFVSHLVLNGAGQARELFHPVNPKGSIESFSVSPNSEYVAIETVPNVSTSVDDGYVVNGRSKSVTTNFVDIATGALVKSVTGFGVQW
jgi:hypothetical protein